MATYDGDGNVLSGVSAAEVKKALQAGIADGSINLGAAVGATLTTNGLTDAWTANAETAYQSLLAAYEENPNANVPFFITTDQHGGVTAVEANRWVNNRDYDGMNIVNLNLGDSVQDKHYPPELEQIYTRSKQIKNYIGVAGNHEAVYASGYPMSNARLSKIYGTTNLRKIMSKSPAPVFAVVDDFHRVKYLAVAEYLINDAGSGFNRGFNTDAVDFIIRELSADDGYDIILLKHWFLKLENNGTYSLRDGSAVEDSTSGYDVPFTQIMKARKAKTSGTYTDLNGVEHSYDFSNCKTDILCCLHGHDHKEIYGYAGDLLCYAANGHLNNKASVFGMIDRKNGTLRVWEFSNSGCLDEFSMTIN